MKEENILVHKTARYFTEGKLCNKTKQIWFVLHGFGMDAKNFLQSFALLFSDKVLFVAPEALNRFYIKGHSGRVGATWMTKEDRQNEIKDYINYLDSLYDYIVSTKANQVQITVLGF